MGFLIVANDPEIQSGLAIHTFRAQGSQRCPGICVRNVPGRRIRRLVFGIPGIVRCLADEIPLLLGCKVEDLRCAEKTGVTGQLLLACGGSVLKCVKGKVGNGVTPLSSPYRAESVPTISVPNDGWIFQRNPIIMIALGGFEDGFCGMPLEIARYWKGIARLPGKTTACSPS